MATGNYLPVSGNIRIVDGTTHVKKYFVAPSVPRAFPHGTPLWTNGANGVEPALLSTTAAGYVATTASGTTYASTYTTVELANAAFAPLFAGFALEARVPQQYNTIGEFSNQGSAAVAPDDASRPFISVADSGIAEAPLMAAVTSNPVEIGTLVELAGFANEATTGFYDASGCLQKDTKTYLYQNAVVTTATAANAIGVVCERAPVGATSLRFTFKSAVLNPASVL